VELIKAGAIGTVRKVDVWCEKQPSPGRRLTTGTPPPTMDYELWQGPAEPMPYNPAIVPFHWRWWFQFAGGILGDMGCHYMDLAHWALDLNAPTKVAATGTTFDKAVADNFDIPVEMQVDYVYPATDARPEVQLTWWHGITGPRAAGGKPQSPQGYRNGVLFQGDKGELLADYGRHVLLPEDKFKDYPRPNPSIPDSIGHHREWIMAIKNDGPTTCNWDYSGALSEAVLLGNVAYRLGKPIEWDAKKLKVKNAKERDWKPLVKPEYHGNWKLKP
jgi:predicted dehydrogenase